VSVSTGGALTVERCTFEDNRADLGGAIKQLDPGPAVVVVASTFERNEAARSGGAIQGWSLDVRDSTFVDNLAEQGGAILAAPGALTIRASWFEANEAALGGGALYTGAPTVVEDTTLVDNTSTSGGAVFMAGTTLDLVRVEVRDNFAIGGGGVYVNQGAVTADAGTVLAGNRAALDGGGAHVGPGTWTGGTFEGNEASSNGGGLNVRGAPDLPATAAAVTVRANVAGEAGGGVHLAGWSTLRDAVIAGNTAPVGGGSLVEWTSTYSYEDGGYLLHEALLERVAWVDNTATDEGGGVALMFADTRFVDCAFDGNGAATGGGLSLDAASSAAISATDFGATAANTPDDLAHARAGAPATYPGLGSEVTLTCTQTAACQ
jgi:hypothetical protein